MRLSVDESHLKKLQEEHGDLIKKYEEIIKTKIGIFTEMIKDLSHLIDGNSKAIRNEEAIADLKLVTEVWERDIYQKKRVEIDTHVDIGNLEGMIDKQNDEIVARNQQIQVLQKELEDAMLDLDDFKNESAERDRKVNDIKKQIQDLKDERARAEAEEAERRRQASEVEPIQPKPAPVVAKYKAMKGDPVDEKMAEWINRYNLDVPLIRLDQEIKGEYRRYQFGSRKIQAKILNDKLVIKVGGGFMLI